MTTGKVDRRNLLYNIVCWCFNNFVVKKMQKQKNVHLVFQKFTLRTVTQWCPQTFGGPCTYRVEQNYRHLRFVFPCLQNPIAW